MPVIDVAIDVPKVLYKYRDWNKCYHKRILTLGEIYFSPPTELNDVFDCQILPDIDLNDEVQRQECRASLDKRLKEDEPANYYALSPKQRADLVEWGIKDVQERSSPCESNDSKFKDFLNDNYGVCSLTPCALSLLMWSHYGCSHKGFCVGFSVEALNGFRETLSKSGGPNTGVYRVQYEVEYPKITLFSPGSNPDTDNRKVVLTKAKEWEYENEYRWLLFSKDSEMPIGDRKFVVPDNLVVEVILGARINNTDRIEIEKCISERWPYARVRHYRPADRKFELEWIQE